jgi:flagellin
MALTITNTNTLTLLNILNRNSASQSNTINQLSTGKRINSGKDDPAGLIALSTLQRELTSVGTALSSNQRTDSVLSVVDGALGEIQTLLQEVHGLASAAASSGNLTAAEVAANQSQIDDALAAIDRIVSTTTFNGKRLLDGSLGIEHSGFTTNSDVDNLRIYSRGQSTSDTSLTVTRNSGASTASATLGFMTGATASRTFGTTEVNITGKLGTATITLASGLTQAQVVTQINAAKDQTGVSAIQGATNISLSSTSYGSEAFVSVEVLSGGGVTAAYGTATTDASTANDLVDSAKQVGEDADISINGQQAVTDGLDVNFNGSGISLSFTLDETFGTATGVGTTSFTVKAAGGATFQLGTSGSTKATIGIDSLSTNKLGGGNGTSKVAQLRSGGSVALNTDVTGALESVEAAIAEVAGIRGRLGGFQRYQVGTAISSLQTQQSSLTQAASSISDTDFAIATANLNQQSVLVNSSIQLLGLANQQSAQILSLLG